MLSELNRRAHHDGHRYSSQEGHPMKAVGYLQSLPITHPESLVDLELPAPAAGPLDLLVRVAAVSVNPVDTKVRRSRAPQAGQPEVLGWDAVGRVEALGRDVTGFAVGDQIGRASCRERG